MSEQDRLIVNETLVAWFRARLEAMLGYSLSAREDWLYALRANRI